MHDGTDRERAAWPIAEPDWKIEGDWVTDAVTGLSWERQGASTAAPYDSAASRCAGLEARLPTLVELLSIVKFDAPAPPTIDTNAFQKAQSSDYWTSTAVGKSGGVLVDFASGESASENRRTPAYSRCVKGGKSADQEFEPSGDVVRDRATGLIWEAKASGPLDEGPALAACTESRTGGFSDWRLPTVRELHSLVRRHEDAVQIDEEAFPDTPDEPFWTATPVAGSTDDRWIVDFLGEWSGPIWLSSTEGYFEDAPRVRCVR